MGKTPTVPLELVLGGDEEPSWPSRPATGPRLDPARQLRVRAGRVRATELELARALFVPPPGYSAARRLLIAGRLVVLYGPPGMGRRTAALHLLAEQGCNVVIAVEPAAPSELTDYVFAPGHGYLVHGLAAPRIAADHLGPLPDRLARADARLVVLVDEPTRLPESVRRIHVAPIRPADPHRVLRRHLSWTLGADVPDDPSLRELTPPGTTPPRAATKAAALATLARRHAADPARTAAPHAEPAHASSDDSARGPRAETVHPSEPDRSGRAEAVQAEPSRREPDSTPGIEPGRSADGESARASGAEPIRTSHSGTAEASDSGPGLAEPARAPDSEPGQSGRADAVRAARIEPARASGTASERSADVESARASGAEPGRSGRAEAVRAESSRREPGTSRGRLEAVRAESAGSAPAGVERGGRPATRPDAVGTGVPRIDAEMIATLCADPDAELDRWFAEHDDPAEAAFLVACAAFEGFDFEYVATAADRLRPELRGDGDGPDDPLGRARRRLIEVAGVRLVPDVVPGRSGRHRVERVVFPPGRATAVLAFVWREYRELRPVLLDWLLDACEDAPPAVHTRVGVVVGTLVGAATGQDVTATFDAWAVDDRPWVRALAARALDAAGRDTIVGTQVRTRLAVWDTGDDPYLAEVAVRVYGGMFGRIRPAVAFDRLQRAAREDDRVPHVADSLVRLMEDDELRPSALAMLARWYDDPNLTKATSATIVLALGAHQPAVDEQAARVAAARERLAYWWRGGHQARSLLVQVLEGTRSHVSAMRALWDLCLLARTDSVLAGQVTAVVTDLLRPPATEGLRWLADDLADRIGADPADDFQRGLLRVIRGFRALDREGPVLYAAEPLPGQRLLGIRLCWDRGQALVLAGHDGRLTAEEPGRRGVRILDVLTRSYAAAYHVELGEQPLTFPVDLPDRSVDVRLTWRVSDPAQVVKRRMRDGAAYVHQVVESRVRRLAADHDADLQTALNKELGRPTELPEAGLAFTGGRAWVPDRPGPRG